MSYRRALCSQAQVYALHFQKPDVRTCRFCAVSRFIHPQLVYFASKHVQTIYILVRGDQLRTPEAFVHTFERLRFKSIFVSGYSPSSRSFNRNFQQPLTAHMTCCSITANLDIAVGIIALTLIASEICLKTVCILSWLIVNVFSPCHREAVGVERWNFPRN